MISRQQWEELRKKYFNECTNKDDNFVKESWDLPVVNIAPHDLFEWIKKQIQILEMSNM